MKRTFFYLLFIFTLFETQHCYSQKKIEGKSNIGPIILKDNKTHGNDTIIITPTPVIIDTLKPSLSIISDYLTPQIDINYILQIRANDESGIFMVMVNGARADKITKESWIDTVQLKSLNNKIVIEVIDNHKNYRTDTIIVKRKRRFYREAKDIALLFAIEDYDYVKELKKPIDDALELKDVLEKRFNFTVNLFKNPTLDQIRSVLSTYTQKEYNENGQLLIFFSGHGIKGNNTGFFVPKDGKPETKYISCFSYNEMREIIGSIKVKHRLLIVDACFSAYLNPFFNKDLPFFPKPDGDIFSNDMRAHKENESFDYITSDAVGKTTPDNSQLMTRFIEGLNTHKAENNYIKLDRLSFNYLKLAIPQPHVSDFDEGVQKTTFIFFEE